MIIPGDEIPCCLHVCMQSGTRGQGTGQDGAKALVFDSQPHTGLRRRCSKASPSSSDVNEECLLDMTGQEQVWGVRRTERAAVKLVPRYIWNQVRPHCTQCFARHGAERAERGTPETHHPLRRHVSVKQEPPTMPPWKGYEGTSKGCTCQSSSTRRSLSGRFHRRR